MNQTRRQLLKSGAIGGLALTAGTAAANARGADADTNNADTNNADTNNARTSNARTSNAARTDSATSASGGVQHVISIWLGGGMGQIDTFDPKRLGDPKTRKAGSYYPSIETSVAGVRVCEHLSKTARLMQHVTAVRSVHHDVIDEHAAATNRMHTGRKVTGTLVYPSLGSIIANQTETVAGVPPYVLIGYPNVTRGPGFLGASAGYLYLTDTRRGPAGLSPPPIIDAARQDRRRALLAAKRDRRSPGDVSDAAVRDYETAVQQARSLSGPDFGRTFDLDREPADLRNRYGGEFGQRCLLARRLCQRGVRFVEVSHNLNFINGTGWDVHNDGILKQHQLISELDIAFSTLIEDLKQQRMLDQTLIMISSEFG
ncbi:MAG: DUF1501 domain-containing protein, partial [Planctomycetota bacterium]